MIRRWFQAPIFYQDEEKTNQARILDGLSWYLMLALLVTAMIWVPFAGTYKIEAWIVLGVLALACALAKLILRRGYVQLSGAVILLTVWLLFIGLVFISGGIASPLNFCVIAITLLIQFFLKPRIGSIFTLLTLLIELGMALVQQSGRELPRYFEPTPLAAWLLFAVVLMFVSGFMHLILRDLKNMLAASRLQSAERQHARITLAESEKRFRMLAENAKDLVYRFRMHPNPGFEYVSPSAEHITGYSPSEYYANPSLGKLLAPAENRPLQHDIFQQTSDSDTPTIFLLARKDGSSLWVEQQSTPIYDAAGQLMACEGTLRDISERKQHEFELQVIATLSAALRSAPTRAEMLPTIVDQIVSLLKADAATIEIIDPHSGDTEVEAATGIWKPLIGSKQKHGTGINAIISQTRKPYRTLNLKNDPNLTYPDWAHTEISGSAGVPLIAQERLIGFIWIGRKTDISEAEVRLLSAIADIAGNAIYRSTLHEQTQRNAAELAQAYDTTLEGWARALELRDFETQGHSRRVIEMTLRLARALAIDESEFVHIRRGAILHDIGKMGIPDNILNKPGPLDDEEWAVMRKHPQYAYDLLSSISHLGPALDIPYCHHENWDGSGYPRGLAGEQIPLAARLFSVVDVWEALRTDRVYRPKWPEQKVRDYIRARAGTQFDPRVVELFLELLQT